MPVAGEAIGSFGNFITCRLATGGQLGPGTEGQANAQKLADAGITCVIDCQAELDDSPLLAQIGHYLWCPTLDDGSPKPKEWFGPGIELALSVLAKPNGRVYIHCAAGVNRGPSMALAVLCALGLTPDDATRLIKAGRPQAEIRYASDAIRAVGELGYV